MKKILSLKMWLFAAVLSLCFAAPALAQTGFEEDVEDVPDGPQAPIDSYVVLAFAGALGLAYTLIGKKAKAV